MLVIGIDSYLIFQAVLLLGIALFSFLFLLKVYAYVTCGYFHDKVRMDGKTVIITGATGGIGYETAKELAKRGARVVMACRNLESAEKVKGEIKQWSNNKITSAFLVDEIVKLTKNENVVTKKLDLSSQKSIREFAANILQSEQRLDVLIHNAGTAEMKYQKTDDGIELTMATNHFGPFLLTHLLIGTCSSFSCPILTNSFADLLKRSGPSRIVVVASELYRLACLNLDKINPQSAWCPAYYYYVSKYANFCFTFELARRLEGTNVTANCLHPGMIDSGIWRNVPAPLSWALQLIVKTFFKTPEQGCQTSVYLACSSEVEGVTGKYFMDCKERDVSSGAKDVEKAKKLWELSQKFSNLTPNDPKI